MTIKNRELLYKLSLLAVSLLFCLGFAEMIIRVAGIAPVVFPMQVNNKISPYRLSDNPILGYVFREGYKNPDANGFTCYSK